MRKIWKNQIFITFALLILITLPLTLYKQSDKDTTIVVSSIGIDKEDDEYDVCILAVIPKGGNDISSNLEVFDAKGKSLPEALDNISLNIGMRIGLAHCDCIIFSEKLLEENITAILDFFIRTTNLSTNPNLVATPKSAKDLLNAVKSNNNLLNLSIKSIITNQEDRTLIQNTTIDRFYRAYFSPNCTFAMPVIDVKDGGSESEGGGGSGGSDNSSGGGSDEQSSGGGSSGGSGGQQKKIENKNDVVIVRHGLKVGHLNDDEKFIYSLVSNNSLNQLFEIKDVTDENVLNSTMLFEETNKFIFPICKYDEDGKPLMEFNIWLSVMMDQVEGKDNYSQSYASGINNLLTPHVQELFKKVVDEKLQNTLKVMHEKKYDVLGLYSKFYAYTYSRFTDYLNTLDNPQDYMQDISFKINLHLNFVI